MPTNDLEFWPDYGGSVLWNDTGAAVPLDRLPLPADLRARLEAWVSRYDDSCLPMGGPGDTGWLDEGTLLLAEVQNALAPTYNVVVTEPWWSATDVT